MNSFEAKVASVIRKVGEPKLAERVISVRKLPNEPKFRGGFQYLFSSFAVNLLAF